MASGISDEQAGITDPTDAEAKANRLALMTRAVTAMNDIADRLQMIERALGANLPDVIKEQPMGDAIDLAAEFHTAMRRLTNDASGGGAVEQVKRRIAYIKEVTLPERMDEEKVKTFNTDRFRVTRTTGVFASILPDQKDAAYEWLEKNELGDLIIPTVNASTLSATAKAMLEEGKELPEDIFRTHFKNGVSVTMKKVP